MRNALLATAFALAIAPIWGASAQGGTVPAPEIERFDRFIQDAAPVCETAASAICVDAAWAFGDADGNGRLGFDEVRGLRDTLLNWTEWQGNTAVLDEERALIFLGLSMVETVGLERLAASFDTDGDRMLSQDELLADVRLDERPLGRVLVDPQAVDRQALGRRLGALAPMLSSLLERGRP